MNQDNLRNIGIFAHIDAGKTTVSERILYYCGRIHKIGEVHDGTTTLDFMEEERERGITITAACTRFIWNKKTINLIDTPGHIDFTIEVERAMRVIDGAILVFCAVGGVEPQTEVIWHQTENMHVPRIGFINKLDRAGADCHPVIHDIREKFDIETALVQIPVGMEKEFSGIIDLVDMQMYLWDVENDGSDGASFEILPIPESYLECAKKYRNELLEIISMYDESLMDQYLAGQEIDRALIWKVMKQQVLACEFLPVFCGSALKNIGIQPLLDGILELLPSPSDVGEVPAMTEKGEEPHSIVLSEDGPFCALVFKIVADIHKGNLAFSRIYRGKIRKGESVYNVNTGKTERIQKIIRLHADKEELLEVASAGDIVAFAGFRKVLTGHTLCDRKHPVELESISSMEPVISVTIEAESTKDKQKLDVLLERLSEEDPTIRVSYDEQNDQTLLSGMGELQLEVLLHRIEHEYNFKIRSGTPQVSYRETILQPVSLNEEWTQAVGNNTYWGQLAIAILPDDGDGVSVSVALPDSFPAHMQHVLEAELHNICRSGPFQGYPVAKIRVEITGGIFNPDKSNEMVFRALLHNLFTKAFLNAQPYLLEPVMEVEIVSPEEYVGTIIHDMNSRGGTIGHIRDKGKLKALTATVALREMFGYITSLRSSSQGRANFVMQFSHYAQK